MNKKKPEINIILKNLKVNAVEHSSGIFIGTNKAVGWSAHSKSNFGLGTVIDSNTQNNINTVFDNDVVDSPIDDRDCIVSNTNFNNRNSNKSPAQEICFDRIDVNVIDTNSTISLGQNSQPAWDSHTKDNLGSGAFHGNNLVTGNVSTIFDNDIIDSPINDQDFKPSYVQKKV